MKFEFARDCLIFQPENVKIAQDVEDLDAVLSMMMNMHGCEMSGAAPGILRAMKGHSFVAVTIDPQGDRFRLMGFDRREDILDGMEIKPAHGGASDPILVKSEGRA